MNVPYFCLACGASFSGHLQADGSIRPGVEGEPSFAREAAAAYCAACAQRYAAQSLRRLIARTLGGEARPPRRVCAVCHEGAGAGRLYSARVAGGGWLSLHFDCDPGVEIVELREAPRGEETAPPLSGSRLE